jgi:hypothetical protein
LNRKKAFGPRNPYGHLCFLTVTVHGQIQVHYQRSGNLFSTFATMIPKTAGRREINRGDVGCFGMSLAGVDDWQRISHATIAFNKQGDIHLATHYASSQPKSIFVYRLDIKFPSNREGGKGCCGY